MSEEVFSNRHGACADIILATRAMLLQACSSFAGASLRPRSAQPSSAASSSSSSSSSASPYGFSLRVTAGGESRIGKLPLPIPKGVTVTLNGQHIAVKVRKSLPAQEEEGAFSRWPESTLKRPHFLLFHPLPCPGA